MTKNELKLCIDFINDCHYKLWDEVSKNKNNKFNKFNIFHELYGFLDFGNACFFCEIFFHCKDCPLNSCDSYSIFNLWLNNPDLIKSKYYAKQIRDKKINLNKLNEWDQQRLQKLIKRMLDNEI